MPSEAYYAELDKLPKRVGMDGFFERTVIVADHALMQAVWVKPHHPPARIDQHPFDQTVFVFSGTLELVLRGTDRHVLKAGDCLYIPADVTHRATVLGDETVHALDVFAPVREEYLPMAEHQLGSQALAEPPVSPEAEENR